MRSYLYSLEDVHNLPTSEFLKTPKGQLGRYNWRKIYRRGYYSFNMEPKSKNAIKKVEKVFFQQNLLTQMNQLKKRAYKGKIAAEIRISPSSKTPPHLHTAVKNLLDLFSKPIPESSIGRQALVYNDDSQISYLSVSYHPDTSNELPNIYATFAPFSSFLHDLTLANYILHDEFEDYVDVDSLKKQAGESYDYWDDAREDDVWDDLKDYKRNKDLLISRFGQDLYDSLVRMQFSTAQEYFLKNSRLKISDLFTLYQSSGSIADDKDRLILLKINTSESLAKWIYNSPIRIELPRIPVEKGETKLFKEKVRNSILDFKKKIWILSPLYHPITLEVLYKPPLKSSDGFIKDLDNIMREFILPIFNEIFEPPSFFNNNSIKSSVWRYDIFEIPRRLNDNSDGLLSVGICDGLSNYSSLWNRVDNLIEKFEDLISF